MHTYFHECVYQNWTYISIHEILVSHPKPQRVIGHRRRYHDTTIPPLDFRSY